MSITYRSTRIEKTTVKFKVSRRDVSVMNTIIENRLFEYNTRLHTYQSDEDR